MTQPLVDVSGARLRRARARRRRRLTVLGIVLGVLALVGGTLGVLYASPWLAVREVRVEGNALVNTEEILAAASVPVGAALAGLDTVAIGERVTGQLPAVADATVTRAWPTAVRVEVHEWAPVLILGEPGSWVWVSREGLPFHTSEERPDGVMVGRGNVSDEAVLTALAAVSAALPPQVSAQATHIEAASVDSVTITLKDQRKVFWGSAEDTDLKAGILGPLLQVKAREYDISAPTHPTTR